MADEKTGLTPDEEQDAYAAFGLDASTDTKAAAAPAATTTTTTDDDDDDDLDDTETTTPPAKKEAAPTAAKKDDDEDEDEEDEEEKAEKARLAKEKEEAESEDINKVVEKTLAKKDDKAEAQKKAEAEKLAKEEAEKKAKAAKENPADLAELERQVNQPHVRPKTKELFAQVKAIADKHKEEAAKLKQELETLKKSGVTPEDAQKLKEYDEIVKAHYTEQSKEVKEKFDKPITEARKNLEKTLLAAVGENDAQKAIVAKIMAADSLSAPIVQKNIKALEEAGLIEEAEAIKDAIKKVSNLTKERTEYIQAEKNNYTERTKKEQEAAALEEKTLRENGEKTAKEEVARIQAENPWLKKLQIDPNEPEDVRKAKEAKNQQIDSYAKESNEFFNNLAEGKYDAKTLVNMAFRMVEAKHYKQELQQAQAKIEKLKARLGEYKKTGKASAANVTIAKTKQNDTKDYNTTDEAVDSMFG